VLFRANQELRLSDGKIVTDLIESKIALGQDKVIGVRMTRGVMPDLLAEGHRLTCNNV